MLTRASPLPKPPELRQLRGHGDIHLYLVVRDTFKVWTKFATQRRLKSNYRFAKVMYESSGNFHCGDGTTGWSGRTYLNSKVLELEIYSLKSADDFSSHVLVDMISSVLLYIMMTKEAHGDLQRVQINLTKVENERLLDLYLKAGFEIKESTKNLIYEGPDMFIELKYLDKDT